MSSLTARGLAGPFVLALFVVQLLSYAALPAIFSIHGDVAPVVETLRTLPTPLLVVRSVPAVTAVAVSLALAQALQVATSVSPFELGTVPSSPGDLLVYLAAHLVAVVAAVARRRLRTGRPATEWSRAGRRRTDCGPAGRSPHFEESR